MLIVANIDYHVWEPLAGIGYLVAIGLSVAVLLIGDEYNGSKRWLSLGTFIFSAFRVCQSGADLISCVDRHKKCKRDGQDQNTF